MADSQRVVVKGDTVGGWIPVPQEMFDATGIREDDILETKLWGKVVPMMRKIGTFVLDNYLADDPRKTLIMQWKNRYCVGANKRKKEDMIAPVVGFIYILDSFKNHRGPSDLGRRRNKWRTQMLRQIAVKSTWKRTHTALAKLIHNRFNMADSNPQKEMMKEVRKLNRRPDIPWSAADYSNLGYPGDEMEVDHDAPLSVSEATKKPSVTVELMEVDDDDDGGNGDEGIVARIEESKAEPVNKTDEDGNPTQPKPKPPPSPPELGQVPVKEAKTALDAEEEAVDVGDGDDGDDDGAPPPVAIPMSTSDSPPPEMPTEPPPSPPPIEPDQPPPSPPPDDGSVPPPPIQSEFWVFPPPPETPSIPGVSGAEDPHLDDDDRQILLTNGAGDAPPPPPPSGDPLTAQRITELEAEVARLQQKLTEESKSHDLVLAEKQDAYKQLLEQLNKAVTQREELIKQQGADLLRYEADKAAWEQKKEELDRARIELEKKLSDLSASYQREKEQQEQRLLDLQKRESELKESLEQNKQRFSDLGKEKGELEKQLLSLKEQNAQNAQKYHEADFQDPTVLQQMQEESERIRQRNEELLEQLHTKENELTITQRQMQETVDELTKAKADIVQFREKADETAKQQISSIEQMKNELKTEYEMKIAKLTEERDDLQKRASTSDKDNELLRQQIQQKTDQITSLQGQVLTADIRTRFEEMVAEKQRLEERIQELEQQIRQRDDMIRQLKAQIGVLQQEITDLQTELRTMNELQFESNQRIADLQDTITQLPSQEEFASLRQHLESLRQAQTDAVATATQQMHVVAETKRQAEEALSRANQEHQQDLATIKTQWEARNEELAQQLREAGEQQKYYATLTTDQSEQISANKTKIKELEERIKSNDKMISDLKESLQKEQSISLELEAQVERLSQIEAAYTTILETIGQATQGIDDVYGETDANYAITRLRELYDQFIRFQEQMKATAKTNEEKIKALELQIGANATVLQKLQNEVKKKEQLLNEQDDSYKQQINELSSQIRGLQDQREKLEQERVELLKERQTSQATITRLTKAGLGQEAALQTLNNRIKELEAANKQLNEQIGLYQQSNMQLQTLKEQYEQERIQLAGVKTSLEGQIASNNASHADAVAKLERDYAIKIDELNKKIEEQSIEILRLTQELGKKTEVIRQQAEMVNKLTDEKASFEKQIEQLQRLNDDLVNELGMYQKNGEAIYTRVYKHVRKIAAVSDNPPQLLLPDQELSLEISGPSPYKAKTAEEEEPEAVDLTSMETAGTTVDTGLGHGVAIKNPDGSDEQIVIYKQVLGDKKRPVYLWVLYDAKGAPKACFYTDGRNNKITPDNFGYYNIPYKNYDEVQRDIFAKYQQDILDAIQNVSATTNRDLLEIKNEPDRLMRQVNNDIENSGEREDPNFTRVYDNVNRNDDQTLLIDPANLWPIFSKWYTSSGTGRNYITLLRNLLTRIFFWLRNNKTPEEQLAFLTNKQYLTRQRLQRINELLHQYTSPDTKVSAIQTSIQTGLLHSSSDLKRVLPQFKKWLERFILSFNRGDVVDLDPELIYYTLTGVINNYLNGVKDTDPRYDEPYKGFGYSVTTGSAGVIPIPSASVSYNTKLYDYYGYGYGNGFNPFDPKLNNPQSYHTSDYTGYGNIPFTKIN